MIQFPSHESAGLKVRLNAVGLAVAVACCIAVILGIFIPLYLDALGGNMTTLLALPLLMALGAVFLIDRKALLLLILLTRASLDLVLESARSSSASHALGLGAIINAVVILLTIMLVFGNPKSIPKKTLTPWIAFFLVSVYGIAVSPQVGDATRLCLAWLSNLAIFISAFYMIRSNKDFRFYMRLILWSSVIPAVYAIYDIAANFGAAGESARLKSTFTHANIFAFYLCLVVFVGFYLIKTEKNKSSAMNNAVRAGYVLYLLALLVLTQTRSAWMACILVFAAYGVMFERRYLAYLAAAFLLSLLVPTIRDRLADLASGNELVHQAKLNSFAWRLALWSSALEWMSPRHYALGYGIGSFRENAPVFFNLSAGLNWDAHNVYVQWFFDMGALGLAAYLWIYARLLQFLRPLFAADRLAAFVATSMLVSYLLISLSDNMMFYLVYNWYFWFAIGAACALVHAQAGLKSESAPSVRGHRNVRTS